MTRHLSCISSFGERFAIVEPVWARIWQWLAALLKPLDTLTDVQPVVNDLSLDPTSRCMLTVFSFLNSIASPTRATLVELGNFTKKLAAQHNATSVLAKVWVACVVKQWSLLVHHNVTQFLVVFCRSMENTPFDNSFRVAVANFCPGSELLPVWSTAASDLCGQSPHPDPERRLVAANQGMLIAATTSIFQSFPTLDKVDVTLNHVYILWNRCIDKTRMPDARFEDLHSITIYFLARFSLRLISGGGPNWIAKALHTNLLYLVAKTMDWMQTSVDVVVGSDQSIHVVFEEIVELVLLHSIYRKVQRGVCRNMREARSQGLEDGLGAGKLWKLWADLSGEARTRSARYISAVCFQNALKESCSNNKCPHQDWSGNRSQFCGGCLIASYCSSSCQRQDWEAGHRVLCLRANSKRLNHPLDYRLDDSDLIVGDLDQLHLIYRGLTYAQVHRDEIRRSIRVRGLTFSRILIELDLTSYPWTWKSWPSYARIPATLSNILLVPFAEPPS
ncbi:hypothetical protein GG344DRAFT_70171 [Lentinula edodes]|nr:hypothetical protein GG344DRAFT_70171 [Lentinula edodes]